MTQFISLVTLGVDDLQRSLAFYRDGLGLPTEGIVGAEYEQGAVAFFNVQPGLKLAIWPCKSIALMRRAGQLIPTMMSPLHFLD